MFVSGINPLGGGAADLVYSTYLGGGASDRGNGIGVTSFSGTTTVYVTGQTASVAPPASPSAPPPSIRHWAAPATPSSAGSTPQARAPPTSCTPRTWVGPGEDIGNGVAIDGAGSAYITGETTSNPFPTTAGAFDTTFGGVREAFVSKLNPTASGAASLVYSTYLGGTTADRGLGVSVDASGAVCVAGSTASTNFPTLNPVQAANGGALDVFVTSLNAAGSALRFSTYMGGAGDEEGYTGIIADKCCVTGRTLSANFPVTGSAFQSTNGGNGDAFVACIGTEEANLAVTLADAPDPVNAGDDVTYTVVVTNNGPHTAPGATVTFPIPAGTTFESVTAPAGWTCTAPPVGAAGTVTCQHPSLAPAATATFVIQAQVASGTAPGTVIPATASVTSAAVDTVPVQQHRLHLDHGHGLGRPLGDEERLSRSRPRRAEHHLHRDRPQQRTERGRQRQPDRSDPRQHELPGHHRRAGLGLRDARGGRGPGPSPARAPAFPPSRPTPSRSWCR